MHSLPVNGTIISKPTFSLNLFGCEAASEEINRLSAQNFLLCYNANCVAVFSFINTEIFIFIINSLNKPK